VRIVVVPPLLTATPTRTPTRTPTATSTATRTSTATPTRTPTARITATSTATPTPVPPLRLAAAPQASGTTSSSTTINWTTTVPTTGQVEYGLSGAYGATTGFDDALTTDHRLALVGLAPATVYHYRVRGVDAAGREVTSPNAILVTARRGQRGAVDDVVARRVTATTAIIGWTASTSVAQVEYGLQANYGLSTLLRVFPGANQELALTNLLPQTLYHYRVKTWDRAGVMATSPDFTFSTAPLRQVALLGNRKIDERRTTIPPGQAYAFQYSATSTGLASELRLFVDTGTATRSVGVALYADEAGQPAALLAQGTLLRPIANAWNRVTLAPSNVSKGSTYWIGVLNPADGGTLALRGATGSGMSRAAQQPALSAFPLKWISSPIRGATRLSAYVEQMTPSVTLTAPTDGGVINGSVPVALTVDDDAPIVSVQFLVDDAPVGAALRNAPYTMVWDTRQTTTHEFHTLSARVTDALGRTARAAPVWVHVDNGATFSQVAASGLTDTSAWISWSTDTYSDAQVEFGPTQTYGRSVAVDPTYAWLHRQELSGLSPNTTYHFRVKSRDLRGVLGVSSDYTFTTPPAPN
jgi:hypothetical protein